MHGHLARGGRGSHPDGVTLKWVCRQMGQTKLNSGPDDVLLLLDVVLLLVAASLAAAAAARAALPRRRLLERVALEVEEDGLLRRLRVQQKGHRRSRGRVTAPAGHCPRDDGTPSVQLALNLLLSTPFGTAGPVTRRNSQRRPHTHTPRCHHTYWPCPQALAPLATAGWLLRVVRGAPLRRLAAPKQRPWSMVTGDR